MNALKIIEAESGNVLRLNLKDFKKLVSKGDLAKRSVVVISIAGAMRKGKSFLLNFFLTYAYTMYRTIKTNVQPRKFKNGLIDGFSHCGGTQRHTTGIEIWPDIFLHDYPNGHKIAIIFMDTQGSFDYETRFSDCVSIFALSTLLSSTQIFNISNNIQNDNLQYLALFVEYAKLALDKISNTEGFTPFDELRFLVRDWNCPYEAEYGLVGGKKILDKTFSSTNSEIKKTVHSIKDAFKKIECFLMPFPGDEIATAPKFDGAMNKIDKMFYEQVNLFTAQLLSPVNLQIKTINGSELKLANFLNLIEKGFQILSKFENIPKPKTIVEATAESQRFKLIAKVVDLYKNSMEKHLGRKRFLEFNEFSQLHKKYYNESMKFYENANKVETFDREMDAKWKVHLMDSLKREANLFLILNEKYKPGTSEILQNLIKVVTEQKDVVKELTEKHAQDMLDLISTFREREAELQEEIKDLTKNFEKSPESGFSFKNVMMKIVEVVPGALISLLNNIV